MGEGRVLLGREWYYLCRSPWQTVDPLGIEITVWTEETLLLGTCGYGTWTVRDRDRSAHTFSWGQVGCTSRGGYRKHLGLILGEVFISCSFLLFFLNYKKKSYKKVEFQSCFGESREGFFHVGDSELKRELTSALHLRPLWWSPDWVPGNSGEASCSESHGTATAPSQSLFLPTKSPSHKADRTFKEGIPWDLAIKLVRSGDLDRQTYL